MNILEVLRNMNLGDGTYNIIGVAWFCIVGFSMYMFYLRCGHEKTRMPYALLFGLNSVMFLHLLTDEINLWTFVLSRANLVGAFYQYWTIPDKFMRFLLLIINYAILQNKHFKPYWLPRGTLFIVGITTAWAIISISTGMYGWEIIDPMNLGKYFWTYIAYYFILLLSSIMFFPNWIALQVHMVEEHGYVRSEDL